MMVISIMNDYHNDDHHHHTVYISLWSQYYGHRNKFKLVGREDELEKQNRLALKMAREVADETGTLMCGDLSNTWVYEPGNEEAIAETKAIFKV